MSYRFVVSRGDIKTELTFDELTSRKDLCGKVFSCKISLSTLYVYVNDYNEVILLNETESHKGCRLSIVEKDSLVGKSQFTEISDSTFNITIEV